MKDEDRTKKQLLDELRALRERVAELDRLKTKRERGASIELHVKDPPILATLPEGLMRKKSKKKYEKPRMTDITPDAKGGLLAFCKRDGRFGPGWDDCDLRTYCSVPESIIDLKNQGKSTR